MSLTRKVKRNQAKKGWKEYNKGLKEKEKISFTDFWRKRGNK